MKQADAAVAIQSGSPEPLYQQIKSWILRQIEQGQWHPGQQLPSENQLVTQLEVSRMTVNRALRELTQDGRLKRVHGVGTFVCQPPRHASLIRLRDIAEEIAEQGHEHSSRVIKRRALQVRGDQAKKMELAPGASCFQIQLVHCQDQLPVLFEDRLVNTSVVPGFPDQDFSRQTPTQFLIRTMRPDEMEHIVRAVAPSPRICKILNVAGSEPCLQLSRRTWRRGQVVTSVSMTYPGSRYELGERYEP